MAGRDLPAELATVHGSAFLEVQRRAAAPKRWKLMLLAWAFSPTRCPRCDGPPSRERSYAKVAQVF